MVPDDDRREHEFPALASAFVFFFLLFASYFMLRPVRETFGLAGGVENLQWLYLGTFLGALVAVPLFGWLSARVPRARLVPWTYAFSAVVMGLFALSLLRDPDNVWIGRAFYIWVSVFNLFVVSIAWSLMADVFNPDQAKRLFGRIAAGASLGGLAGPLTSGFLVAQVGLAGLLVISTALLLATLLCVRYLLRWRREHGHPADAHSPAQAIGGGIWAGLTAILRSPQLRAISLFVILLTAVSTFLYFEQARVVKATFPDKVQQTQAFASIDAAVQGLTIFIQLFVTGQIAKRFGLKVLLTLVPVLTVFGFLALASAPTFTALAAVMILRRVGEYALIRPGREILFSAVDAETKYKSKNAIDTAVYRGGDVLSAWLNTAIVAVGSTGVAALAGAVIAALWAGSGWFIGRRFDAAASSKPDA
ncbi:MAG: putative inner rane protein [Novosphingobium sp.]|nr:putative inner rane protein [Novosphingobium sp.]